MGINFRLQGIPLKHGAVEQCGIGIGVHWPELYFAVLILFSLEVIGHSSMPHLL